MRLEKNKNECGYRENKGLNPEILQNQDLSKKEESSCLAGSLH